MDESKPRNGPKNAANRDRIRLNMEERRLKVVALRKSDRRPSLQEIADELGCSVGIVHKDIAVTQATLRQKASEAAEELRQLDAEGIAEDLERTEYDLGRLDGRLEMLDRQVDKAGPDGDIPIDPDTIRVMAMLVDSKAKLLTKRTELRARRAKMFGVDAPEKIDSTVNNTVTTPGEARRVMQELFGKIGPKPAGDEPIGSDSDDRDPEGGPATE